MVAALITLPASAGAAHPLTTGLGDVSGKWDFKHAQRANVKFVKAPLSWASVVGGRPPDKPGNPSDHSYSWHEVDSFVRQASRRGLQVVFNLTRAPTWAEGPGSGRARYDGTWKPSAKAFGKFAQAVARRYSGHYRPPRRGNRRGKRLPRVRYYMIWAEANRTPVLEPQWENGRPASPGIYRGLVNAASAGIKSVHSSNRIIGPSLAPYGFPRNKSGPSGPIMRPVYFLMRLFCLKDNLIGRILTCRGQVRLDIVSHNPINSSGPPDAHAPNPDDAISGDLGRISRVAHAAERAGTLLPKRRHPLWATETWWESNPPSRRGVPPAEQARRIIQALFIYWHDGASVVIQQRLRDGSAGSGSGGGLFFKNGKPKPAYRAFRFPFLTKRKSARTVTAWGKAPRGGKLLIQRHQRKGWKKVKRFRVHKGQVFKRTLKLRGGAKLRATVGSAHSLPWKQGG